MVTITICVLLPALGSMHITALTGVAPRPLPHCLTLLGTSGADSSSNAMSTCGIEINLVHGWVPKVPPTLLASQEQKALAYQALSGGLLKKKRKIQRKVRHLGAGNKQPSEMKRKKRDKSPWLSEKDVVLRNREQKRAFQDWLLSSWETLVETSDRERHFKDFILIMLFFF